MVKVHKYREIIELQKKLSSLRKQYPVVSPVRYIAGADVAYARGGKLGVAAVLVYSFPEMAEVECAWATKEVDFPYIPGLLSFREAPVIVEAAAKLTIQPDVLLVDGQGMAHPRRFGLACHVGVELDWPTIGCAKSRLVGTHREVGLRRGNACRLMDGSEVIGMVLRTRDRVKCIYVSEGHRVELAGAVKLVLECCRGFRLPEPVRQADKRVALLKKGL